MAGSAGHFWRFSVLISFLLAISAAWPQNYPATIRVPVTFYDYHSNGSNPEFQPDTGSIGYAYGRHCNMVSATLNGLPGSGAPILGSTPYWNCSIDKWFKPWTPGDFNISNYTTPYTRTCENGLIAVSHDTAYKNIIINDTLVFNYAPGTPGTYIFDNSNFFPLDGKGFGGEGKAHNYSFAMELHWGFTMAPGLKFNFRGDDDVWVFINGQLVMDIGGIHSAISDSIVVDDLGLSSGQKYWFDLFYCERCVTQSSIRITRGLRGDGSGIWDDLEVFWGNSNGMVFDTPAPTAASTWRISPTTPAAGLICISFTSEWAVLSDTLHVFFALTAKRNFSAVACDDSIKKAGIDNDDYVLLTFDKPVEIFPVAAGNIDIMFPLSNGHSWLNGSGSIGQIQWSSRPIGIHLSTSRLSGRACFYFYLSRNRRNYNPFHRYVRPFGCLL